MEKEQTRFFLVVAISLLIYTLFSAWQEDTVELDTSEDKNTHVEQLSDQSVLMHSEAQKNNLEKPTNKKSDYIIINTDKFSSLKINLNGGDIEFASLADYKKYIDSKESVELLINDEDSLYVLQTDIFSPQRAATPRYKYTSSQKNYSLKNGEKYLEILLTAEDSDVNIKKIFTFTRDKYTVDVDYIVTNKTQSSWNAKLFGRIKQREGEAESTGAIAGMGMYKGGAAFTNDKPYQKISYSDIEKANFKEKVKGGWIAMVDRYFITAWIPQKDSQNTFVAFSKKDEEGRQVYRILSKQDITVGAGETKKFKSRVYMGPELIDNLKPISEGLEYTIDYGIFWPISGVIFWLLKNFYGFTGNWGWAIVSVTVVLKLMFYSLSAKSYRSMAKTKQLQPKLEKLKEQYGEDKEKMGKAVLELYRKEKVNPLTGCLPLLIQIPVFIALYYVLLESVELRHSPFILWINDLSVKDPFYVLPLLMGVSMFVQQKISPPPADPVQAKVFAFMPLVFTVLFMNIPAGLALYWALNSILSNLQQWFITRSFAKSSLS